MICKLIILFLCNLVFVCSAQETVTEDTASSEPIVREIEDDLDSILSIAHQLSRNLNRLDQQVPPIPGQKIREPPASLLNLIRSFFHLLESMTGQARIEGDEVDQIVKEINRILYSATRFLNVGPDSREQHQRKGKIFQEHDPHYQKIREVVHRVMIKSGMNKGSPSSPAAKACDCAMMKGSSTVVTSPPVTSPPLTSTILVAGASPSTSLKREGRMTLGLESRSLGVNSGPWITGDGFLKENAVELKASATTEGPPTPPPILKEGDHGKPVEGIVPVIQPVSNATEVPSGINWVTSSNFFFALMSVMREYATAVNFVNQRVANVTAEASRFLQTSSTVVSGQLKANETTWVYGEPLIRATEGYVDIMRSLTTQLTTLGQQFENLRQLIPFAG